MSAGYGVSIIRDQKLNYQKSGDLEMGIDLETLTQTGVEDNLNMNYYTISEDPLTGNLFVATADFVTNSQVYIYDSNNIEIANFTSGVTTNKIVFDVRNDTNTSIDEKNNLVNISKSIDILGRSANKLDGLVIDINESGICNKMMIIKK